MRAGRLRLPPVTDRVRVSARVTPSFHERITAEVAVRREGRQPGGSVAELCALAVYEFAQNLSGGGRERLVRLFRAGLVHCPARWDEAAVAAWGPLVHLQPRLPAEHVELLDVAVTALRDVHPREPRASRRTVLISALNHVI